MVSTRHDIHTWLCRMAALLLLLVAGSVVNEVWSKEIRYHILTLPFSVRNYNNTDYFRENIRVEALLVKSNDTTIGLPEQYKSPLANNFKYWTSWETPTYGYLFHRDMNSHVLNVKYYIYSQSGGSGEVSEGDDVGDFTDIYVTYDYNSVNEIVLDGTQDYNISVGGTKYLCYNRSRNNRLANANSAAITGEHLASQVFVVPEAGTKATQLGFNWSTDKWHGDPGVHMRFWFTPTPKGHANADPYNITLMTSYTGNETYERDPVDGDNNISYVKPYRGATLFTKILSNDDNKGSDSKMWFDCDNDLHYKGVPGSEGVYDPESANYWEKQVDQWPGFFRQSQTPIINAIAILNHPNGGYAFVATKMNQGVGSGAYKEWAPNKNGNYATLTTDNNNPMMQFKSLANSPVIKIYKIRDYTFKVKTHGATPKTFTADMWWSDVKISENIVNQIPEVLKRKYCSYKAYADEELTTEITTFDDAKTKVTPVDGKIVIWLDYTVTESMPFDTLAAKGGVYDYNDAHWYTMRVNGKAEAKNIAYKASDSNNFITGSTSVGDNSDLHHGENSAEAMVAFVGDPYRLKIISRKSSEVASANRYVGCASGATDGTTLTTNNSDTGDISTWEIMYESTDMDNFVLRQFDTYSAPKYVGWSSSGDKPVIYSETSTRIRVVDLQKVNYTYHIMRADHSIAVKATVNEYIGKSLKDWKAIPTIIRSPFLSPYYTASVTYYASQAAAEAGTPTIANAPYDSNRDIYVRYSFETPPAPDDGISYNVSLNNEYIYTNGSNDDIYSQPSLTTSSDPYVWTLKYKDPYSMKIWNRGKERYVKISSQEDNTALTWEANENDASLFIVKQSGDNVGIFEVMLATGETCDAGNAAATTTYYNIGRNASGATGNTTKLFSNATYNSGYSVLQFQLTATDADVITYHLIDKAGKDLLQVTARQTSSEAPSFPPQYRSPLVSSYHYYALNEDNFTVSNGTYTLKAGATPLASVGAYGNIYVTYDVNDLVNLKRGQLYLLKYEAGQEFRQEDGSDGVDNEAKRAIYPYVNGDCNFFVYGQEQYDLQQEGAASTRTRWAWFVQSDLGEKGDPYHVKIRSRQSESYPITNSSEYNAFFATFKPDGYSEVVTTLVWPGISGETATDYMVLGNEGQYQLMTSYKVDVNGDGDNTDDEDERRVVNSFEQYWKTFDTIKKKLLNAGGETTGDDLQITVPATEKSYTYNAATKNGTYRTYLEDIYGFHHYEGWAYAKRWNGYNNGYSHKDGIPETKKGWEKLEHWYQTVSMGEGYFDFVETTIDPVMILLDQHGWEIMRKPLPSSPDDPEKPAKYEAIRKYNSPMVKEYAFWATAKKRTGLHQYYLLSDRIGGDDFTSTDLTSLAPYGSKNVLDKKGNLNDQYVTYIVKDEYAQSYNPDGKAGVPFLIEQGSKYATTTDGTTITKETVPDGGMEKYIVENIEEITDAKKWYVKPNWNIDCEMGYKEVTLSWTKKKDNGTWDNKNPNSYEQHRYKNLRTAVYIDQTDYYKGKDADGQKAIKDSLGFFSFSNGFDPYNIQIMPVSYSSGTNRFMKTNATGAKLEDGIMHGVYSSGSPAISLGDSIPVVSKENSVWFDSRQLSVTNATFMAVQDAAGNMQLMPRFDQDHVMSEFGTLILPDDASAATTTHTKLYRAVVYDYRIIDNDGHESLRYKSGGDLLPQTPEHFKSPLAKDYAYYASATLSDGTYTNITDSISGALDGVALTDGIVYVRYAYDEDADPQHILKGNWLTMQVNEKDAKYDSGIQLAKSSKPATVNGNNENKPWQWKFLGSSHSKPDPYAVYLYNRSQTAGTKAHDTRFAILSHSEGDYALVKTGGTDYTYQFLNGSSSSATVATESGFKNAAGTFNGTVSQVKLFDDVQHDFKYKVYTNGGVFAIDANQDFYDVAYTNDWKPVLPETARTPLLDLDQYRYYEKNLVGTVAENDTANLALDYLFGLYDDIVYTHYTPYSDEESDYQVPNVRNATSETIVARHSSSNDAPLGLDGIRPYNFIWYDDNMMKSNGTAIAGDPNKTLQASPVYEWELEGDDPYAINIKNVGAAKYIHEKTTTTTELSTTATPFMLINRDGYQYGVLAKTGAANTMLSGNGNTLVTDSDPNHFIIFALSTYKVIYHLMIKNIGNDVIIPYRESADVPLEDNEGHAIDINTKIAKGTTMRDLATRDNTGNIADHIVGDKYQLGGSLPAIGTNAGITTGLFARDSIYCYDAGHVSLGDVLKVPDVFYRPNVNYEFYVEGIYSQSGQPIPAMNNQYQGLKMTNMGEDGGLLDNIVFVNIVYSFGVLDTNTGDGFVTSVDQNKWYTYETSDATPKLAEYTGITGTAIQTQEGHTTHYTNDYLWTPVGDPYGFKMYNRYGTRNGQNVVMTTSIIPSTNTSTNVIMTADNENAVYELLATNTTTPGYFHVHPVVNKTGLQYYMAVNSSGNIILNTVPKEWTFGLSEEIMSPYYQAAGYVGGLTPEGKAKYEATNNESTEFKRLVEKQKVVFDDDNIVKYTPGFYRLHSQPGSEGLTTPRYASGYTHKIELTAGTGSTPIPLHFYEQTSYSVNNPDFTDLASGEFTETPATRGEIPLQTVTSDPASIFYFAGEAVVSGTPSSTMQTQGLYVKQNVMTETEGQATTFNIIDIGGAIVALQGSGGSYFLCYNQSSNRYDLKYATYPSMESARWCMQPVQKGITAGDGEMALRIPTNDGKDDYYYATFYAPFDVLLTDASKDIAYVCKTWNTTSLTPENIGKYNTAENGCPNEYIGNNRFIPAGTAAIIRTSSTNGYVTAAIPTTTPSTAISSALTGQYLEQMLPHGSDYVYVFGLEFKGESFTEDASFATNGLITAAGAQADKTVGFYKNMNRNREAGENRSDWTRNNKYVLANKIYYRESAGSRRNETGEFTRGIDYIPVLFDMHIDVEQEGDEQQEGLTTNGDNCIYDMQGRCVATEEQVRDGSWRQSLSKGMYILNGKKFMLGN